MHIPDPYQGNYKLLIIAPIVLVLASLFFIPQIEKGVDFKGGTLATMQTASGVDADAVKSALSGMGFTVSSVKSLQNPTGFEVEVEIERSEELNRADELKTAFYEKIDAASQLESDITATNGSADAAGKYAEARRELDGIADGIFGLARLEQN